jgi:predicted DNA-binding helix-hairpin-helix protein
MTHETLIEKIDLLLRFQGFYAKEFVELGALAVAAKIDKKLQSAKIPFPTT